MFREDKGAGDQRSTHEVSDDVSGPHDGRPHDERDTEEPESRCGVSGDPLVKVVELGLDVLQHDGSFVRRRC